MASDVPSPESTFDDQPDRELRGSWWVLFAMVLPLFIVAGGILFSLVCSMRDEGARRNVYEQFKDIGNALYGFHDEVGHFPTAVGPFLRDGKLIHNDRLSWRVAILPYLEHQSLYDEFHLDEPWDSPHNITLLNRMPDQFRRGQVDAPEGHTFYRAFVGIGCMERPRKIIDLIPGSTNTPLVAEARHSVPWTKPDELDIQPGRPIPPLGREDANHAMILTADGGHTWILYPCSEPLLRRVIDPTIKESITKLQ